MVGSGFYRVDGRMENHTENDMEAGVVQRPRARLHPYDSSDSL